MKPKRVFQVYNEDFDGWHSEMPGGGYRASTQPFPGATKMPTWRFRVLAPRAPKAHRIVGGSGESFDSKGNAMRAARREASLYTEGVAAVEVLEPAK